MCEVNVRHDVYGEGAVLVRVVTGEGFAARDVATTIRIRLIVLIIADLCRGKGVRVDRASDVSCSGLGTGIKWESCGTIGAIAVLARRFNALRSIFANFGATATDEDDVFEWGCVIVTFIYGYSRRLFTGVFNRF